MDVLVFSWHLLFALPCDRQIFTVLRFSVFPLILGTRGSALALAQTTLTLDALRAAWPDGHFDVREIRTTGDKRQDLSLTHLAPGGHGYVASATVDGSAAVSSPPLVGKIDPGLFTKELEAELLAGTISVAVHSLKDLPTVMPAGLKLAAVLPRADTADVLVWKDTLGTADAPVSVLPPLPFGAWVATSSLRRARQLLHARPDLRTCEIRGNVGTRLRKLHEHPDWTGTVLALAGLERLGYRVDAQNERLENDDGLRFRATILGPAAMLPAVGQGAIGLQARVDDTETLRALAAINDAPTWTAVTAERELLRRLGGGCQLPLGVSVVRDAFHVEQSMRAILFSIEPVEPPRFAEVAWRGQSPEAVAAECARQLGFA